MQEDHLTPYDHQSNGLTEIGVKLVTHKIVMRKLCLENNVKMHMPAEHALMHGLAEFAAWHITTCVLGVDGRIAYQHVRGRPYTKCNVRFAERVLYKLPPDGPLARENKLTAK